jgi:hypothetical protein
MCLYFIKRNRGTKFFGGHKTVTCYKVLSRIECPTETYLSSPYYDMPYLPGWNYSRRRSKQLNYLENKGNVVNEGIHVYIKKPFCNGGGVTIPVQCDTRDLIAISASGVEAVFMKVYLHKQTYTKACRGSLTQK